MHRVMGNNKIEVSLSFLAVPCLLQARPPRPDPFPDCRTACTFIPKHADMSLTELHADLLQNASDTNPLPASDVHTLIPAGLLHT